MKLDPFYPIVETPQWVENMVALGVRTMQLRAKDLDEAQAREIVADSLKLCQGHDVQLIINDYWNAAIECNADWLHLGQGDLETADMMAIKQAGLKVGLSTHDHSELERALKHEPDYIALGPVYHTTLKQMPWAPQGMDRVKEWKSLIKCPLVAIGGISLERADEVWAAGADSLSVVTDIVFNDDPDSRTKGWLNWAETKRV
jgi:thiamine-phosphate pyrophosphorylase